LNEDVVRAIPYATEAIEAVTARETAELKGANKFIVKNALHGIAR